MLQVTGILLALAGLTLPGFLLAPGDPDPARLQGVLLFRVVSVATGAALFAMGRARFDVPEARPVPWLPLAGVIGAALVLRLIGLDRDLWYDEVVTLTEFVRLPTVDLLTSYTFQNNHILFTLLAKLSVGLFGESAAAVRLPAVLFGVGSVAALFFFARRIVPDRQALFAAALVAFSYHHVWFSQNARGYTGLMFFGLVASTLFLDGLRQRRSHVWLAYAATFAAAMYVHLTAVFLFATHGLVWLGLWLLARRSPGLAATYPGARSLWPLAGLFVGGLLTLQVYALIVPHMFAAFTVTVTHAGALPTVSPWQSPLWTLLEMLRRIPGGLPAAAVATLGAAVAFHAWWRLLRRDPAAAWVIGLPIPLTLATLILAGYPHVWPRYFFQYQGFAALLLVEAVAYWGARLAGTSSPPEAGALSRPSLAILSFLVVGSLATLPANYRLPKQAYRDTRDFVEAQRGPGEPVVTVGLTSLPYERLYAPDWTSVADADELERLERQSPGVWVVYSFPTYMQIAHADVLEATQSRYQQRRVFPGTLGDGALYVFHRRGGATAP